MNSTPCLWPKGRIFAKIRQAGAVAAGCAVAGDVAAECAEQFSHWLASGNHGSMDWLRRHEPLRRHPRYVMPGVRSIISMAFVYSPPRGYGHQCIADYALGLDYHIVLRKRLQPVIDFIAEEYGAQSRICVDTAPLPERYWATRAGVGVPGRNGQLIVPGIGAGVFLASILTTLELTPDSPLSNFNPCEGCTACIQGCPGKALKVDGTMDARKCLSYLTIEHRGEWPQGAPGAHGRVYGCDICRRVCPYSLNSSAEPLPEFLPRPELMQLQRNDFAELTAGDWPCLTRSKSAPSAMSRLPYPQLRITLGPDNGFKSRCMLF